MRILLWGILRDMNQTFWEGLKGQVVMGSDEFAEDIYERYLSRRKMDERQLPGLKKLKTGPTMPSPLMNEPFSQNCLNPPEVAVF